MRATPFTMMPKPKPQIQPEHKKQSLASILARYEKQLCQDVFLKLDNQLPIVEMIQTQKGNQFRKNKENSMWTPVKDKQDPQQKWRSPTAASTNMQSSTQKTDSLIFKAKEGKLMSLRNLMVESEQTQKNTNRQYPSKAPTFQKFNQKKVEQKEEEPQPSFAINMNEFSFSGLDVSEEQQVIISEQIKMFQQGLLSIFDNGQIKLSKEAMLEIQRDIRVKTKEFAKKLLSDCTSLSRKKSQESTEQAITSHVPSEKNKSLFFSFQSPISLRVQTPNRAEQQQLAGIMPGKEQPKIVSNVALVVSRQTVDEKQSQKAGDQRPMIKLDQFEWMRPINIAPATHKQLQSGVGFHVDLGLSDLELSRSLIDK